MHATVHVWKSGQSQGVSGNAHNVAQCDFTEALVQSSKYTLLYNMDHHTNSVNKAASKTLAQIKRIVGYKLQYFSCTNKISAFIKHNLWKSKNF